MTVCISAFRWVPPFAQGFVKDLRVRWALAEAGIPFVVKLIDASDQGSEQYRAWQPFGQVPAYRDDDVELFESGAIVLHIAHKSEVLAPKDLAGRARVSSWIFAALNSIEPPAQNFIQLVADNASEPWAEALGEPLRAKLRSRLSALSASLGQNEYLEDRFTAGDLMMTTVLRELVDSGVLAEFPVLDAWRQRCEARPAFASALEAQLKVFREHAPVAV